MPRYRTKAYVESPFEIEVEAENERDAYDKFREQDRQYTVTFEWDNLDCYIFWHSGSIVEVEDAEV